MAVTQLPLSDHDDPMSTSDAPPSESRRIDAGFGRFVEPVTDAMVDAAWAEYRASDLDGRALVRAMLEAAVSVPTCWSDGCTRYPGVKSERYGGYLCAQHAVNGPVLPAASTAGAGRE